MAEWGKGDPRWIVEKREDGQNVNSWHWEEKDCSKWARAFLEGALEELAVEGEPGSATISKLSKFEGEVNWYNRKGKLFTLYDLQVNLDFKGQRGEDAVSGTIKITDFEQDCEDSAGFRVTVGSGPADDAWKKWVRNEVKKKFLTTWSRLIHELHEDQKSKAPALQKKESGKIKLPEMVQKSAPPAASSSEAAGKTRTTSVTLAHTFQAAPKDLWDMFTDQNKAQHFTQAKTMIDAKEGGFFQLYDGNITGCFLELKPYTEMRFAWRLKDWKPGVNSQVVIKFVKSSGGTKMELSQTNVPWEDMERTRTGWAKYYFERWRGIFGYSFS